MAFTIVGQMMQPGPDMFYEPRFRQIIEDQLPSLRILYSTREDIPADEYYQYEGDFYGFLYSKGYRAEMFWVVLRVNGMTNPLQFGKSLRDPYSNGQIPKLLRPRPEAIAEIQQYYMTLRR